MKEKQDKMTAEENFYSLSQERAALSLKQRIRIKVRLAIRKKANPLWVGVSAIVVLAAIIVMQLFGLGNITARGKATKNPGTQLTFVGDVMLSRGIEAFSEKYKYSTVYSGVKHLWKNSDYVFANLEGALLVGDAEKYSQNTGSNMDTFLPITTKSVKNMVKAGINVVGYANNHTADYKRKSVDNAVKWFDKNNIKFSGVERVITPELDEKGNPVASEKEIADAQNKQYTLLETKSGKKIGFIAITDSFYKETARYKIFTTGKSSQCYNYVTASAEDNDLTVVYMHWGTENVASISSKQREIAHNLIDAGADIVIGSNPMVLQGSEIYNGKMIFYSLGNFVMDTSRTYNRDSVIVQFNETKKGAQTFTVMPVRLKSGCPEVTENPFYAYRIRKAITSGLAKDSYSVHDNGNIIIKLK